MAFEEVLGSITLDADASVAIFTGVPGLRGAPANPSGLQYRFVKLTGEHQCGLAVAATDLVVGVLQNKPQAVGDACTVGYIGISKIEAAGVIAAGGSVTCDASGRAVASGANVMGYAIHSAGAAGQLIPVLLRLK